MNKREEPHRLYSLLRQLDQAKIHYTLDRVRDDTVMIHATVPGRRYEIEVFSDGSVEVEVFGVEGAVGSESVLADLLKTYAD